MIGTTIVVPGFITGFIYDDADDKNNDSIVDRIYDSNDKNSDEKG